MKKACALLLCASMALSMAACGGQTTPSSTAPESTGNDTSSTTTPSEPTELSLWTFVDQHAAFYEKMAEEWNKENPDKQVKLATTVLPYEDMHNKLTTTLQSSGAPDICDVEVSKFANYLKGTPALLELNSYIDPYRDSVVKSRLDTYGKGETNYGVPFHVGATVMYYNTELLDQAGIDYTKITTWDEYRAAAKTVKEKTGKSMGFAETKAAWTFSALLTQQGADLTDADGNPDLTSDAAVKAATLMQDMVKEGTLEPCTGGQPDEETCKGYIADGNIASVLMPLWYMSRFTGEMADNTGKWAIAPVPTIEKGQPRSLGLGGTGTVVTNQSKAPELAAEFLVWAKLSPTGEKYIWEVLGFDPVNKAMWTDESITKDENNQFIKYFKTNPFDVLNEVKDEIQLIKNVEASPSINTTLTTTTLNELFVDMKDPKEALQTAQETVEGELN